MCNLSALTLTQDELRLLFASRRLIPEDPDLWRVTLLPEFVLGRQKIIRQRLLGLA